MCVFVRTEEGEQAGARGVRRVAEGQGEDGPGSVGDSVATPIVVWRWWWWRWSDGRVGRRKKKRQQRGGGRARGGGGREKGRVDLQLRRESQAVTDRQTNLTALSFSSFSLLRLHSRPASPMHRVARIHTHSHTPKSLLSRRLSSPPASLALYPVDLSVFLRLSLSFLFSRLPILALPSASPYHHHHPTSRRRDVLPPCPPSPLPTSLKSP